MHDLTDIDLARTATVLSALGYSHMGHQLQAHDMAIIQLALMTTVASSRPTDSEAWETMADSVRAGAALRPMGGES